MPTQNLTIEIGKLMSSVQILQNSLGELKKDVDKLGQKISSVHNELSQFMGNVQNKTTCQLLHDRLKDEFVLRQEIAPIKNLVGIIVAATGTALVVALLNLILK